MIECPLHSVIKQSSNLGSIWYHRWPFLNAVWPLPEAPTCDVPGVTGNAGLRVQTFLPARCASGHVRSGKRLDADRKTPRPRSGRGPLRRRRHDRESVTLLSATHQALLYWQPRSLTASSIPLIRPHERAIPGLEGTIATCSHRQGGRSCKTSCCWCFWRAGQTVLRHPGMWTQTCQLSCQPQQHRPWLTAQRHGTDTSAFIRLALAACRLAVDQCRGRRRFHRTAYSLPHGTPTPFLHRPKPVSRWNQQAGDSGEESA